MASLRTIVTQISTRVFLGPELSHNKKWVDSIQGYTDGVFKAVRVIWRWPCWSRPIVHWFLSDCADSRRRVKEVEEMIQPIVAKRLEEVALANKGLGAMPNDAITWMDQTATKANKTYHAAHIQLSLSMASGHTTSDLFSNILLQLCEHPEWIEPLLQEANEAVGEGGWEKTSLYRMKLADSMMKETQRIKPLGVRKLPRIVYILFPKLMKCETVLTHRFAHEDVTLQEGTFIPKGSIVSTNMSRMWDPEVYPLPDEWQPDRYLRMRSEPGKENSAQFVTTTMDSLGFGIGSNTCPGRFFASNKVKILLAYVLQNYEFERVDAEKNSISLFLEMITNPKAKLRIRKK